MIGYESGNDQISSGFKYVNLYNIFDHVGICTHIILQVFVDLEVLKSNPPPWGEVRDNPNPPPVAR